NVVQTNVAGKPRRLGSHDLAGVGGVLLLWIAVWAARLQGPIDLRWDASTYFVLGTSLAEGKGYRLLNEPGEIEAVQYPPLLPALVAAHQWVLGTNDYVIVGSRLRRCYFLLSGAYLLAAYFVVRGFLDPPLALAAVAGTGFSFYSFLYPSDSLYAEIPFALVSMLFLLCLRRREQPGYGAAAGLLAGTAYLIRTAGIALLAVWVVDSLLRRRFRQAALRAAVAALPVIAWQAYTARVSGSAAYHEPAYPYQRAAYYYSNVTYGENSWLVDPFQPELGRTSPPDLVVRVGRNLLALPRSIGESAWIAVASGPYLVDKLYRGLHLPWSQPPREAVLAVTGLLLALIGAGALVGAGLLLKRGEWLFPVYFGFSLAMISLTPWSSQFWRYLAPLTPLSLMFLIVAVDAAARRLARLGKTGRTAGALVATAPLAAMLLVQVVIAAGFLRLLPISYYAADGTEQPGRLLTYEPVWHALDPALEYIRRRAESGKIIATSVPHLAYLRTGHQAVLPPLEADPETAARYLDAVPVSFLVLDELGLPGISERYAAPVVARHPASWRLVYTTPDSKARVYERVR
ncbi:MAG TPA: hypothetical protein VK535_13255, partial [Gemmatimonadales bacterium]|nr:hypothetical protein [Gemmatimonadales bacterium]